MTMAAALMAVSMQAQNMYVGGSMGFSTSSYDGTTQYTNFSLIPEFGIQFNDKFGVGAEIGYTHGKDESHKNDKNGYTSTKNAFTFAPYVRFTAIKLGNLSIFADGKLGYTTSTNKNEYSTTVTTQTLLNNMTVTTTNNTEVTTNAFGVYVQPGIAYSLNKNFSLVAKFGNILGYTSSKPDYDGAKSTTTFSFMNISNAVNFGLYYNF